MIPRTTTLFLLATALVGCQGTAEVGNNLWDDSGTNGDDSALVSTTSTNSEAPTGTGALNTVPTGTTNGQTTAPILDEDMGMAEPDMADPVADLPQFSFFVTSLAQMQELSGSQDGFGGDLGGLAGADGICQSIATSVGFGAKTWRAFLSVTDDGNGSPVHAIDRVGAGPWYDRNGRLVATDLNGLLNTRPDGDLQSVQDLPDENGMPNSLLGDSHDTVTGSNNNGMLADTDPATTCNDWTSDTLTPGRVVMAGHSWPRSADSGLEWISDHAVPGCTPGVNLVNNGAGSGDCIGCSGGYGGFYCFALEP